MGKGRRDVAQRDLGCSGRRDARAGQRLSLAGGASQPRRHCGDAQSPQSSASVTRSSDSSSYKSIGTSYKRYLYIHKSGFRNGRLWVCRWCVWVWWAEWEGTIRKINTLLGITDSLPRLAPLGQKTLRRSTAHSGLFAFSHSAGCVRVCGCVDLSYKNVVKYELII